MNTNSEISNLITRRDALLASVARSEAVRVASDKHHADRLRNAEEMVAENAAAWTRKDMRERIICRMVLAAITIAITIAVL